MPDTITAYKNNLRLAAGASLLGPRKIFSKLAEKLAANNPQDQHLITLMAGHLPTSEQDSEEDDSTNKALLTSDPVSIAVNKYDRYCQGLLANFKTISQSYADYQTNPGWLGHINRYFTNRAYPTYSPFANDASEDFITLLDAISLIDTSGTWISALNSQLKKLESFSYENQENLLNDFYAFFVDVQTQQTTFMEKRFSAIKAQLITQYNVNNSGEEHRLLSSVSEHAPLPDAIDQAFQKELLLPPTTTYLEANPKLAYDLQLLTTQWQQEGQRINALLKALKKKIHHLAQALGTPCRLVRIDSIDPSLWHAPYDLTDQGHSLVSLDKQSKRALQQRHRRIGTTSAAIIGIGEGLVAVTGLSGKTPIPPAIIMLVVGLSGWYINYLLFRGDIRGCLDEFFIKKTLADQTTHRRILLNQDHKLLSKGQAASIGALSVTCLAVGLVFGALSFVSSKEQLPLLLQDLNIPLTLNPLSLSLLPAAPAIAVGIGFTAIFLRTIIEGIKNEQWQDLAALGQSLAHPAWNVMTVNEQARHIYHATLKCAIMGAATAITGIVAYFSFPVFNKDCHDLLTSLSQVAWLRWLSVAAPTLAFAATLANTIVSIPFQIKAPYEILSARVTTECTFASLTLANAISTSSPLQNINHRIQALKICLAVLTGLINAAGQGFLFMDTSSVALMIISISMAAAFSFFPNIKNAGIDIARHHDHLCIKTIDAPNLSIPLGQRAQGLWIAMPQSKNQAMSSNISDSFLQSAASSPLSIHSPSSKNTYARLTRSSFD